MDSHAEAFRETTPGQESERLPHSPATLERWFRDTPAILHSIDSAGRLIAVSNAWLEKFGYAREEVLGRRSIDFLTPASRDYAIREVVSEFYRTGRRENIEYQMVCKDGRVLDILLSAVLDPGDADCGPCSLAVITDISAMRAVERRLAESEALYKGLVESQTDMVSLATPGGVLLFVNHAYGRLHDRQPSEMIGTNLLDYIPAEYRGAVLEQFREVEASKQGLESENQVVMPDGRRRWMSWTNRAIVGADGQVTAIHSVGRDIERRVVAERLMQESEARYRLLAENSSDLVMLVRKDGRRIYVSPACEKLLGWSPEEMSATTARDMIHPEDLPRLQASFADDGDDDLTLTYRIQRKDGAFLWVEAARQRVELSDGIPTRLIVIRDVEQRMEAEHRLKESEARYRLLAENSSDMVLLLGKDGRRIYVSPACQKLLGWSPEEMLAMSTRDALHPEDFPRVWRLLTEDRDEHVTLSYRMRRKDGEYLWVEAATQRVEIPGHPPQRLLVVRDIEQRLETERRLKEREASYRLLADHSSDMVFQLDRDLVRRYVSPASSDILGYEPSELIGRKPVEKCHPDDVGLVTEAFRSLLAGETDRLSLVNRRRHRNGRWIWVESQMRSLRDPCTGAPCGVIGALRDISARKTIEDQLGEANRRLEILATQDGLTGLANRRAFDDALTRERLRARRERTPLGLILIDVDRFKSYNDRYGHPAGDECLRRVADAIARTTRRSGDIAARYGGEEFVVLLPHTDERGAAEVAERIRLAVRDLGLQHEEAADGFATISAGVAALVIFDAEPCDLVARADRALYRAKEGGRDQVVNASWLLADQPFPPSVAEERKRLKIHHP